MVAEARQEGACRFYAPENIDFVVVCSLTFDGGALSDSRSVPFIRVKVLVSIMEVVVSILFSNSNVFPIS